MKNATKRVGPAWPWSRVAGVVALLAAAALGPGVGACRAALIISTTPLGGPVLQLPDIASTRLLSVTDPNTGVLVTLEGGGNLFGAQSATDRLIRISASADLEGFLISFSNPNVYTGVTVRDVGVLGPLPIPPAFNVQVAATDQLGATTFGNFAVVGNFTFSVLATSGSTLRSVSVSTPGISSGIGPIELQAVPEPSTLISGVTAGLMCLGYGWRRRRKARVTD